MQFALFDLPTAILALKRPYLALDLWVRRSPHEIGLPAAMRAGDRLNGGASQQGFWISSSARLVPPVFFQAGPFGAVLAEPDVSYMRLRRGPLSSLNLVAVAYFAR